MMEIEVTAPPETESILTRRPEPEPPLVKAKLVVE